MTQHWVQPLYLVCDESEAMSENAVARLNESVIAVLNVLAADPIIYEKARISMLCFAGESEVVLPLMPLVDIDSVPLCVRSSVPANYGAMFRSVKVVLKADIHMLLAEDVKILRPCVLLFTAGRQFDTGWEGDLSELVRDYPSRPIIVTFGLEDCPHEFLLKLARPFEFPAYHNTFLAFEISGSFGVEAAVTEVLRGPLAPSDILESGRSTAPLLDLPHPLTVFAIEEVE